MKKLILLSGFVALTMNVMGQDAGQTAASVADDGQQACQAGAACAGQAGGFDPRSGGPRQEMGQPQHQQMSVYDQADEIRNRFGLDYKQFDKVYSAYNKFNTAIFGDETSSSAMGGGMPGRMGGPGGGMGGPGGGMGGPGGGMGGPGGGMGGPGGGMGGPGGGMGTRPDFSASSNRPKVAQPMTEKELQKRQKKITKQEEKLEKSMRKVLTDESQYHEWLKMRQEQLKHVFPAPPAEKRPAPAPGEKGAPEAKDAKCCPAAEPAAE
jgi:hypothetical protein